MRRISSIASVTIGSLIGTAAFSVIADSPQVSAQVPAQSRQVEELIQLCQSAGDSDARLRCLFEQSTRLNQAKNLARQRGERENGGVTVIETEPSMHGSSAESPYTIEELGGATRYVFTYRLRPRATTAYTREAQVAVTYDQASGQWDVDTVYNQDIAPTSCSYAQDLQGGC